MGRAYPQSLPASSLEPASSPSPTLVPGARARAGSRAAEGRRSEPLSQPESLAQNALAMGAFSTRIGEDPQMSLLRGPSLSPARFVMSPRPLPPVISQERTPPAT